MQATFGQSLGQTVTVITPGSTTDEYGNVTPNWTSGTTSTAYDGFLEQTESTEVTVGRDTIVTDWRVLLPAAAVIDEHSRVTAGGRTFEVVGHPHAVETPAGVHHIEARLVDSAG